MHHTFNTLTRFQKLPCSHSNKVTSEIQCTVSAHRIYRLLFICQFCLHIVFLYCCIVYRCVLLPVLASAQLISAIYDGCVNKGHTVISFIFSFKLLVNLSDSHFLICIRYDDSPSKGHTPLTFIQTCTFCWLH